jgi:nucleotide-binding universal stress UspA family protein
MSNIDKRALREAAERARADNHTQDEWFHYLRCSTPETVLALLDELEAKDKRIAELERKVHNGERQDVIDQLCTAGEPWEEVQEYMQKWDAERAAAAGKGE